MNNTDNTESSLDGYKKASDVCAKIWRSMFEKVPVKEPVFELRSLHGSLSLAIDVVRSSGEGQLLKGILSRRTVADLLMLSANLGLALAMGTRQYLPTVEGYDAAREECRRLFERKNADYGDTFRNDGVTGILVRLKDKYSRAIHLLTHRDQHVADESLLDTYRDLVNYSIMGLIVMREDRKNRKHNA